jgi:hypothetical protein
LSKTAKHLCHGVPGDRNERTNNGQWQEQNKQELVRKPRQDQLGKLIVALPIHIWFGSEVLSGNRLAAFQRHGLAMVTDYSDSPHRLDTPGSSQDKKGDCSTVECCR